MTIIHFFSNLMSLNPDLGHGMDMKRIFQTRRRPRKRVQRRSRSMSIRRSTMIIMPFIPTQGVPDQLLRIRIPVCLPPPPPGLSHRHDCSRMPTSFPVNRRPVIQNLHIMVTGQGAGAGKSVDIPGFPPRVLALVRIRGCPRPSAAGCKRVGIRFRIIAILIRRRDSRSEGTEEGRVGWYTS